jgi:hypothetical protein
MGWRRYKGDKRNFSTIPSRTDKEWGDGRFFVRKKNCLICGEAYKIYSNKSLYCSECKKKMNLK